MTSNPIRVVLADDHALVREGIRRVLDDAPEFAVVAEAADGHEALEFSSQPNVDVVLLDLTMPGLGGLDVARQLRSAADAPRVIILSMHDEEEYVLSAVRAGAHGYLLKDDAGPEMLRRAVLAVHEGETFFSPGVAAVLAGAMRGDDVEPSRLEALTDREREVLRLLSLGRSNKEMAAEMGISPRTVESHRENLVRKLGIRTVAELTRFALQEGLLRDEL